MSAVVKVRDLSFKVGNRNLLNHINWTVEEGEHWLLFGLNGSGKTTLLSMIAGYASPTSGSIEVFGQSYNRDTIFKLRQEVGWISSSFFDKHFHSELVLHVVLSALTGTFNVDQTITAKDVRDAKHLLRAFGLESKMNLPYNMLSMGQRQSVLIVRALITRPKLLILDEPSSGLDIYVRKYMQNIVESLAQEGLVNVLYVTHYPSEIRPYMNKALLMRHGGIVSRGATDDIFVGENLARIFSAPVGVHEDTERTLTVDVQMGAELVNWFKEGR